MLRICQKHWDALKAAIKKRGLDHTIAQSGEAAVARLKEEAEGKRDPQTFDALMACNNMIFAEALKRAGMSVFAGEEPKCPICEALQQAELFWIEGPADAALNEYETLFPLKGKVE